MLKAVGIESEQVRLLLLLAEGRSLPDSVSFFGAVIFIVESGAHVAIGG